MYIGFRLLHRRYGKLFFLRLFYRKEQFPTNFVKIWEFWTFGSWYIAKMPVPTNSVALSFGERNFTKPRLWLIKLAISSITTGAGYPVGPKRQQLRPLPVAETRSRQDCIRGGASRHAECGRSRTHHEWSVWRSGVCWYRHGQTQVSHWWVLKYCPELIIDRRLDRNID